VKIVAFLQQCWLGHADNRRLRTKIGALIGLPSIAVSGPVGPAVTASIGAIVGGSVGGIAGIGIGAKVGASLTTWGLFRSDPLKCKILAYKEVAKKELADCDARYARYLSSLGR
jgi:hypothetical protein